MFLVFLGAARTRALHLTEKVRWVGPLLARITVGILFATTGWGKVHDLDRVTAFFTELGIPAPAFHAVLVSYVELIGGGLLVLGLGARLAAVPLVISMTVAILTAQASEIHGLSDLFGLVEWTYLTLLVWIALAGPGAVSLDWLLFGARKPTERRGVSDSRLAREPA